MTIHDPNSDAGGVQVIQVAQTIATATQPRGFTWSRLSNGTRHDYARQARAVLDTLRGEQS